VLQVKAAARFLDSLPESLDDNADIEEMRSDALELLTPD